MKLIYSLLLLVTVCSISSSAQSLTPGQVTDNVYNKALLVERFALVNNVNGNKPVQKEINFSVTYNSKHNSFTGSTDLNAKAKNAGLAVRPSSRFPEHAATPRAKSINFMQLQLSLRNSNASVTINNLKLNGMDITGSYTANTDGDIYWHLVYGDFGNDFTVTGTMNLDGRFSEKDLANIIEFNFGSSTGLSTSELSVYWGDVAAEQRNNANIINWNTNKEENSDRFVVERAADGINFTGIGLINSAGNKTTVSTYNFADSDFTEGVNYYRIKQVDMDGHANYSVVVRVTNNNTAFAQANNSTAETTNSNTKNVKNSSAGGMK